MGPWSSSLPTSGHGAQLSGLTEQRRVLIRQMAQYEMSLEGQFPEYIEFANEKGVLIRQMVQYEWLPTKCTYCKMFGHSNEDCRKKDSRRKEWRPKAPPAQQEL